MLKYVIIREPYGTEFPAFCVAPVTHAELAGALQAWRHGRTVVAAGFLEFSDTLVRTFGRSESLDLGHRPQDCRIISAFSKATAASCTDTSACCCSPR